MKEFVLQGTPTPQDLNIDYDHELNEEQLAVIKNGDGPCLVLAGAGSGKTRTITYRVAWLLEHGVPPSSILLLTFTNKASHEMIERVQGLLGGYAQGMWAGTFHSVANRLLRTYATRIGFESNFSILDQEDARDLFALVVKELKIDTKGKRFPNAKVLQEVISLQRNAGQTVRETVEDLHPKFLPIVSEIEDVARLYEQTKKWQNSMDFDDLLLYLLALLREDEAVAEQLSQQFQYVLVDEFQDTNVVQAALVERLSRAHRNILVVGDDAQSIYSFRGAEIKNILQFPKTYPQAKTFRLTTNYRSTPQILHVANAVIHHNQDQFEKELKAVRHDGELPSIVPAQNSTQEAQYIAEQILELAANGTPLDETAVLFRASFHSQALEFELMKRDIPYEYRGGLKFFERSHVKDVIAHLRLIANVRDAMAWVRVLRLHPGIGLVTANKIAKEAGRYKDVHEALSNMHVKGVKAAQGVAGATRVLSAMLRARNTPSDFIRALAAHEDYALYLENEFPNYQERLEDLEQFAVFAEQFDDLPSFLEAVSLTNEFGASRGTDDLPGERVVLSTIHQAKGLEWDAVFVMNVADGKFPHSLAYNDAADLEEERRLFYVATTRARKQLFFTYPVTSGFEHVEIQQPSMFLGEIPAAFVQMVTLRRPGFYGGGRSSLGRGRGSFGTMYEEPSIVLDETGETMKRPAPSHFLIDVDTDDGGGPDPLDEPYEAF